MATALCEQSYPFLPNVETDSLSEDIDYFCFQAPSASLFEGVAYSCSPSRARLEELNTAYFRNSRGSVQDPLTIASLFQGADYPSSLSRARFEELNMAYFRNSKVPCITPPP